MLAHLLYSNFSTNDEIGKVSTILSQGTCEKNNSQES